MVQTKHTLEKALIKQFKKFFFHLGIKHSFPREAEPGLNISTEKIRLKGN